MRHLLTLACGLALFSAVGCAQPAGPGSGAGNSPSAASAADDGASKTLVLAQANILTGFGVWAFSNTNGGGASLGEIHTSGLVTLNDAGNLTGRMAAAIPSFDDGSIKVLADGRMETTWHLRPGVTWQDGAPFDADDVLFTQQVHSTPVLRSSLDEAAPYIERIDKIDPLTVLITWKTTYYNALYLDHRDFWLMPKHLLGPALESDPDNFLNLPYFTSDYVSSGPFRLTDWGLGQNMVFQRYDNYFMGRPRVGQVLIRVFTDDNTLLASLKA